MALKQLWCETAVSRSLRNVRNREGTNSQWSCSNNTGGSRDTRHTRFSANLNPTRATSLATSPEPTEPRPPFYCAETELDMAPALELNTRAKIVSNLQVACEKTAL